MVWGEAIHVVDEHCITYKDKSGCTLLHWNTSVVSSWIICQSVLQKLLQKQVSMRLENMKYM